MIEGHERLGILTAELMEQLEESEVDEGHTARLGEVMIVVEVDVDKDGGEEEDGFTAIRTRCSSGKYWIQKGLLAAGAQRLDDSQAEDREAKDDEE